MRWIAGLGLAVIFVIGGCPGSIATPVVTILTAGTYTGTLTCTGTRTDSAGPTAIDDTLDGSVAVNVGGQLSIYGDNYVPGDTMTATTAGVTITRTVDSVTESGDTVTVKTTGTIDGQGKKFDSTHDISIRQVDPTHLELIDTESSIDSGNGISVQQECGGTLSR